MCPRLPCFQHLILLLLLLPLLWSTEQTKSDASSRFEREDRELIYRAHRASGIWAESSQGGSLYHNTVLVTAGTLGYLPFLRNWICRAEALKLRYLVIALDVKLFNKLIKRASGTLYAKLFGNFLKHREPANGTSFPYAGPGAEVALYDVQLRAKLSTGSIGNQVHHWRSKAFNTISCGKIAAASILLAAGLNVLFIDADVVMLRAPTPIIPSDSAMHYAYQANIAGLPMHCTDAGPSEGNTGVYWARNSSEMIKWFARVRRPDGVLDDLYRFSTTISFATRAHMRE